MKDTVQEDMEKMKQILKSHKIKMSVGSCGCCNSPWIHFEYEGEVVFDADGYCFDTEGEKYE